MTCGSCGVRNVDFASTFSCRQPLGKIGAATAPALVREALDARKAVPRRATRNGGVTPSFPGRAVVRVLLVAAVASAASTTRSRPTRPPENTTSKWRSRTA
jgi:hypothetical protein